MDTNEYYAAVQRAADSLRERGISAPEVGIVLGSGLGDFADALQEGRTTPYGDIPHWPATSVVGHAGRLALGSLAGRRVATLSGRVHLYEGHAMSTVTFATRVLGTLGVRTLILTNAAGGINVAFEPGTLMLIEDHINLLGDNPLIGPNDDTLGPRFPDMSEPYSHALIALAEEVALERRIRLQKGTFVAVPGPNLETRAEYRFLRTIGADVVGMSTVPEVIVARHMSMQVFGLSIITDEVPHVPRAGRIEVKHVDNGIYTATLHYGFMQDVDVPSALLLLNEHGVPFKPMETSYFLGRETLIASKRPSGMAIWREKLFAAMSNNARSAASFFRLPPNKVVELGTQVEL